ncbi:MAG: hypothetical protein ACI9N9_002113 [Enterobacterales bacterium]|jgi:uncharacterized protein (DUF305 family)
MLRTLLLLILSLSIFACSDDTSQTKSELASDTNKSETSNNSASPKNSQANIVQPGKPGEPSRLISTDEATDLAHVLYTKADTKFMQGMIMHHAQALDMTELVDERSENPELLTLAKRIEVSQEDEIKSMQDWLKERNQEVTTVHAHHANNAKLMPGMLSPQDMSTLQQARTNAFDKLFLELMIKHHHGALIMVKELMKNDGAAQESIMFAFATDIAADQKMEIKRMAEMLSKLSPDPRVGLKAGYLDADFSQSNVKLLTTLNRPAGFYSPQNPAGLPANEDDEEESTEKNTETKQAKTEEEKKLAKQAKKREEQRKKSKQDGKDRESDSALWNFANTDMAFTKDLAIVGNYHGFNIYNIAQPESPLLISSVVCPGGQGDVSVVDNILIMSVEQTRGRLDCGLQGVSKAISEHRMRGIRIFDISDLKVPKQVAVVQTCRGSHTHTVVTDPNDEGKFYVYVSGTGSVRDSKELEGCSDARQDPDTALFSIDVVEISKIKPEEARLVNQPRIFADPKTGSVAGLWVGGDHGRNTQESSTTDHCHDITVFPELNIAAGACSGNGILMDISDPINPVRLDAVTDKGFAYWHSATFNNDGTKVIFTDEWGGGSQPRCRASDPKSWGANAIFDIVDNKLEFRSYYKLSAPQTENENCVAHNGSLVPIPGRDIMVQAWYQGGLSIFDFTDSVNPIEIAYFDRGPLNKDKLILSGYWSTYWHKGVIYGSEIARGLDVLKPLVSEFLTANELEAANTIDPLIVNAQFQKKFTWPIEPSVASAYADQLLRQKVITQESHQSLAKILKQVSTKLGEQNRDKNLAEQLNSFAEALQKETQNEKMQPRVISLVKTLQGLAQKMQ